MKKPRMTGPADQEVNARLTHPMSHYRNWVNYNAMGRVVSHAYMEIERDHF
jgi:hypothetical protein